MAEKIKVKIAGRMYPLQIKPSEEVFIRDAAAQIEKMILNFEQNYAVEDKQDALAMCVLHMASQLEKQKTKNSEMITNISEQLEEFVQLTEAALNNKT